MELGLAYGDILAFRQTFHEMALSSSYVMSYEQRSEQLKKQIKRNHFIGNHSIKIKKTEILKWEKLLKLRFPWNILKRIILFVNEINNWLKIVNVTQLIMNFIILPGYTTRSQYQNLRKRLSSVVRESPHNRSRTYSIIFWCIRIEKGQFKFIYTTQTHIKAC